MYLVTSMFCLCPSVTRCDLFSIFVPDCVLFLAASAVVRAACLCTRVVSVSGLSRRPFTLFDVAR